MQYRSFHSLNQDLPARTMAMNPLTLLGLTMINSHPKPLCPA